MCEFLVIVKPDAVERKLTMDIIREFANLGFVVGEHHDIAAGDGRWRAHYAEHEKLPHYEALVAEMSARPATAFIVKIREDSQLTVADARDLTMKLREKHGISRRHNSVHCSETAEEGSREIALWFSPAA